MKLGLSYNLFDGEELLEGSIRCIRDSVDYISVVYQTVSNFGNQSHSNILDLLTDLKHKNLIDNITKFDPEIIHGSKNELIKRNIGLDLSRKYQCTHHMSIDTDEYYIRSEFDTIKQKIIEADHDASFCQMMTYYKSWEYVLDPPENYYVPLIYKIKDNARYTKQRHFPVVVDPTRKMSNIINPIIFDRSIIQLHHGSYIRNNLQIKLENSSASVNFNNKDNIKQIVDYYNTWIYPKPATLGGKYPKFHNIKKLDTIILK